MAPNKTYQEATKYLLTMFSSSKVWQETSSPSSKLPLHSLSSDLHPATERVTAASRWRGSAHLLDQEQQQAGQGAGQEAGQEAAVLRGDDVIVIHNNQSKIVRSPSRGPAPATREHNFLALSGIIVEYYGVYRCLD